MQPLPGAGPICDLAQQVATETLAAGGPSWPIRFGQGTRYIALRDASPFHRALPAITCRPPAVRLQLDSRNQA